MLQRLLRVTAVMLSEIGTYSGLKTAELISPNQKHPLALSLPPFFLQAKCGSPNDTK